MSDLTPTNPLDLVKSDKSTLTATSVCLIFLHFLRMAIMMLHMSSVRRRPLNEDREGLRVATLEKS